MMFIDIAGPLAARGIKVVPVQPLEKRCLLEEWQKKATTDINQIEAWNNANPQFNVGCVGTPDTVAILDCDQKGLMKRIEKETGQKFPPTLVVRSGGKGAAHVYFRQNQWSRKLGNRQAVGLYDLQSVDKYVVGPHSKIAREDGTIGEYCPVDNSAIAEFPEWLYEWIDRTSRPAKRSAEGGAPVHEDFDFSHFCEHYGIGISGVKDGVWHVVDECPGVGRRHDQSTLTGFYFDGETLGWNCFASSCPTHGMRIGELIKFLNQTHKPYDGVIWQEQDEPGLMEILESFQIDGAPEAVKEDCYRAGCRCGLRHPYREEAQDEGSEEPRPGPEPAPGNKGIVLAKGKRNGAIVTLTGIKASEIEDQALEWLWDQRMPLGKIVWMAGKPDCGKSVVLIDLVARISSGRDFPDGSRNPWGARRVLLGCTEDGLGDTVKPRLMAAGANLGNVIVLDSDAVGVDGKKPKQKRMLKLSEDIKLLKATLKDNPDIILVALDPITGYFGADSNKDAEIRPVMDALAKACDEMKATFVAVMHQNKRSDVDAIHKILGASSVAGSARTAWGFSRDQDDKNVCHMSLIKSNLSKKRTGLDYRLVSERVMAGGRECDHAKVEWLGENEDSADDLLDKEREAKRNGSQDRKIEMARHFLRSKFDERKQWKCTELYCIAEAEGIMSRTLKRARESLTGELDIVVEDRRSRAEGYWWCLYAPEPAPLEPEAVL